MMEDEGRIIGVKEVGDTRRTALTESTKHSHRERTCGIRGVSCALPKLRTLVRQTGGAELCVHPFPPCHQVGI